MLFKDLPTNEVEAIKALELQADSCMTHLNSAGLTGDAYVWSILTETISIIEHNLKQFGSDNSHFKAAMINLGRHAPWLIEATRSQMPATSDPNMLRSWDLASARRANEDLAVARNYDSFLTSFPMWYRNQAHAELKANDTISFTVGRGSKDRQVSAFQKGLRRLQGKHKAIPAHQVEPTEAILKRYGRILAGARVTGPYSFSYEHSYELARRTFNKYMQRLTAIMRRSDDVDLGAYNLGTFKRFYAALQSICAIHDYMCFCWMKWQHPFPHASSVMVKSKDAWVKLLSGLARLDRALTGQIVADLVFSKKRLPDLHVFPFVPLDSQESTLAVVPQFIFNSNPDGNILRICSYLRPKAFNLLSNDKEKTMRDEILAKIKRFNTDHSIELPDQSTEIDLLVEDVSSSSLLLAELKWYRKPSTYRERLQADEQLFDGLNRQVATVRNYCRQHPEFLKKLGKIGKDISEYRNVYYMLIGRDHWNWCDPSDQTYVVDAEQFIEAVSRHESLEDGMTELLSYEWLPIEDEDFHVKMDGAMMEGVCIESEIFFGGPN